MPEEEKKTPSASAEPATTDTPQDDINALEGAQATSNDGIIDATGTSSDSADGPKPDNKSGNKKGGIKGLLQRFNIYLLLFVFILGVAGVIIAVAYFQSKSASTTSTLKTQDLTQATLDQVANSDAAIGDSQQVLTVRSSTVFSGKVLIRSGLEVAGNLNVGGTLALNNISVSGASQLGQVQVNKNLAVAGDTGIQGSLTVAKSLQVNGGATFAGPISAPQITTSNLQLNSDLILTRHIVAGGGTPSRSTGPAIGSGGSASNSGSDTAGSVSINTGGGASAGCFVTINFTSRYNSTPRILLTPVGSGSGTITYYVNRTTSNFSICASTPPPSGASFGFDYFVIN